MTRREWIGVGSGLTALLGASESGGDIKDVYRRSIVIDGLANAGTFNIMWPPQDALTANQLANLLPRESRLSITP